MVNFIYTIYDKIAEQCGPIFEAKNDGVAKRYYKDLVLKETTSSGEYTLYRLGQIFHDEMRIDVNEGGALVVDTSDIDNVSKAKEIFNAEVVNNLNSVQEGKK